MFRKILLAAVLASATAAAAPTVAMGYPPSPDTCSVALTRTSTQTGMDILITFQNCTPGATGQALLVDPSTGQSVSVVNFVVPSNGAGSAYLPGASVAGTYSVQTTIGGTSLPAITIIVSASPVPTTAGAPTTSTTSTTLAGSTGNLPGTGSDTRLPVRLAAALLALGLGFLSIAYTRHRADAQRRRR